MAEVSALKDCGAIGTTAAAAAAAGSPKRTPRSKKKDKPKPKPTTPGGFGRGRSPGPRASPSPSPRRSPRRSRRRASPNRQPEPEPEPGPEPLAVALARAAQADEGREAAAAAAERAEGAAVGGEEERGEALRSLRGSMSPAAKVLAKATENVRRHTRFPVLRLPFLLSNPQRRKRLDASLCCAAAPGPGGRSRLRFIPRARGGVVYQARPTRRAATHVRTTTT